MENIRTITIPSGDGTENLILTGDQNVIDIAYSVRWNIKDPQGYLFQIAEPERTIQEVAESAMRAVVARVSLDDAIGAGRSDIEQSVERNCSNAYDLGGTPDPGIDINQSVPRPPSMRLPAGLAPAGPRETEQARAYALQITAKAQGDATAFEKVYAEFRAAPEVTRRRMYYETMERILSRVDTTIIEAPGVTPYLPLPEVQRRQAAPAPAAQQGEQAR